MDLRDDAGGEAEVAADDIAHGCLHVGLAHGGNLHRCVAKQREHERDVGRRRVPEHVPTVAARLLAPDGEVVHLAEIAALEQRPEPAHGGVLDQSTRRGQVPPPPLGLRDEVVGAGAGERNRLPDEHVLVGLERPAGDLGPRRRRRRHDHGVEGVVAEQVVDAGSRSRRRVAIAHAVQHVRVAVTEPGQLGARQVGDRPRDPATPLAEADDAEREARPHPRHLSRWRVTAWPAVSCAPRAGSSSAAVGRPIPRTGRILPAGALVPSPKGQPPRRTEGFPGPA